jgi:hypothetical protein|uniref:Nucleoside recognition protein n=1 Tax=Desulfobacca acetoxidans TaxID=60893 RepID=A0A7C3YY34_9BACT
MTRRRIFAALAMGALVGFILAGAVVWGRIPMSHLYIKLVKPLLRMSLAIGAGLLLGIYIENANLTAKLGRLFAPFLRFGHLREPSALAFTTAFVSAAAATPILMNAYKDGSISRRELVLSALILTFPAFFAHLPSLFFTLTPLVGVLGIYYLLILLAADIMRTTAYLVWGRLTLPPYRPAVVAPVTRPLAWKEIWQATVAKFLSRLYTILVITIPVFVGVFLAQEGGLFAWLNQQLAIFLAGTRIPTEAVSILIFSLAAEATGGFAAAGALLSSRAMSPAAVLFTLILGTIISSPMRAVRHQLPFYLGVYTPKLGLKLIVFSQFFRSLSLVPFLLVIYLWWF